MEDVDMFNKHASPLCQNIDLEGPYKTNVTFSWGNNTAHPIIFLNQVDERIFAQKVRLEEQIAA